MCVQEKHGTKEEVSGGRLGGARRQQINNFGPPWQTCRKLRGGGLVGIFSHRMNQKGEVGRVGSRHAGTETIDAQVGE